VQTANGPGIRIPGYSNGSLTARVFVLVLTLLGVVVCRCSGSFGQLLQTFRCWQNVQMRMRDIMDMSGKVRAVREPLESR
jgi:hypothetical protein